MLSTNRRTICAHKCAPNALGTMSVRTIERALHWYSRLRTRLFTWLISSQFAEIGRGARISPPLRFWGLYQISLGEGVMVHRDCWIHVLGDSGVRRSPKIIIGSRANIGMGSTISAAEQVMIGEYALLARNVYISDHAHAFEDLQLPIVHQGISRVAPVSIGPETWLGQNVVVLPGVTIGRHCVVGANSVVRSSVPDFSIAVGAPATVVKRYDQAQRSWVRANPGPVRTSGCSSFKV